jgi:citrate lyase subunit beta/citryl-CoA lyase
VAQSISLRYVVHGDNRHVDHIIYYAWRHYPSFDERQNPMTITNRRRVALCVPASAPTMVAKAFASKADEVVVDLEDAVAIEAKAAARAAVSELRARPSGSIAVRVNAAGTLWHEADLAACVANPSIDSVVVPKVESAGNVRRITAWLEVDEKAAGRTAPLSVQALIESPRGLQNVAAIADSDPRLASLIIGYADLAASLGRQLDATWQFARDAVLVAARSAGVQAIDGPHLTVADDDSFASAVAIANSQGFDGKWVIHPRQIDRILSAFSPTEAEVADARELIEVMENAQRAGTGAVAWRGRMLDEALVLSARRTLERAGLA